MESTDREPVTDTQNKAETAGPPRNDDPQADPQTGPRTRPEETTAQPHARTEGRQGHPLSRKITAFPHLPGVYIFRDESAAVLYVGKARDIRKRVGSYFRSTASNGLKTRLLVEKAADIEYIVTSSEKEALLLEASLIKKHRPRYNVILRDDKNYPALRIDPREPFPCIEVVRRFQRDGALYFGPYPSAYSVREILKLLNRLFPLRQCKGKKLIKRLQPCLNYSMGKCQGPCADKLTQEQYAKMVEEVVLFLQGKTDVLQSQLKERMEEASAALEFERAAFYRDRLRAVDSMLEKQHIVSGRFLDQDVLGIYREGAGTELVVLYVRQGTVIGQKYYDLHDVQGEEDEVLSEFIYQYYARGNHIPDEVLSPVEMEAGDALQEWLSDLKGKRVHIRPARRGDRKQLLELAAGNARQRFLSRKQWEKKDTSLLESLQKAVKLPRLPTRMACVDISNIQGRHAIGAIVVFSGGHPDKSSYRLYRIESKTEPDDPSMMAETVERFLKDEKNLVSGLDLLVLDGGKGQLNRIRHLLESMDMTERLPLISFAKEREQDRGDKGRGMYEKVYAPGRKNPLFLSRFPEVLHLLQRLRDEAHRFAVSRYQNAHLNNLLTSELDAIAGVGETRRLLLLNHFGSIEAIERASVEEIQAVPGITEPVARAIVEYFKARADSRKAGNGSETSFESGR